MYKKINIIKKVDRLLKMDVVLVRVDVGISRRSRGPSKPSQLSNGLYFIFIFIFLFIYIHKLYIIDYIYIYIYVYVLLLFTFLLVPTYPSSPTFPKKKNLGF